MPEAEPGTSNLGGQLGVVQGQLKMLIEAVQRDATDAKASRGRMFEKVDRIQDSVTGLQHRVGQLEKDMDLVKPALRSLTKARERGAGWWAAVLAIGGVAVTVAIGIINQLISLGFDRVFS